MARKSSGYTPHRSNARATTKPIIYWEEQRGRYVMKFPPAADVKNRLLLLCPSAAYLGASEGAWSFIEPELEKAKALMAGTFGDYDFIEKPQPQSNFQMRNGATAAAIRFFNAAGPEMSTKIYKKMMIELHPDINPGMSHDKAAELNKAWSDLKKELGW